MNRVSGPYVEMGSWAFGTVGTGNAQPDDGGPMIDNPYDWSGGDRFQAVAWGRGYLYGLTGPYGLVDDAPVSAAAELYEPFADGIRSGRYAASAGLDIFSGTIDTVDRSYFPVGAELVVGSVASLDKDVIDVAKLASSAFSTVLMAFTNSVLATHQLTPAARVVSDLTRHFGGTVAALGHPSCDFFLGGAIDIGDMGAELRLTPLFRTQSAALSAATNFGRPRHFVARWSSERCAEFTVLDAHWPSRQYVGC